ncbi:MAG: serpin family protein [Vulcanimicrobiota bacterium]
MRSIFVGLCFLMSLLPALSQTTGGSVADFGFDYFRRVAKDQNAVVSPLSMHAAFAMLTLGVSGRAETETLRVLRLPKNFAVDYQDLLDQLKHGPADVNLASKVWTSKRLKLQEGFVRNCASIFGASPETLDLSDLSKARKKINDWVSARTEGLIPELLPSGGLNNSTELVLSNALYFKGQWTHGFSPDYTREGTFRTPEGEVQTPFMRGKVMGSFLEEEGLKAVSLPYQDSPYAMLLILPDKDLASIRPQLDKALLAEVERLSEQDRETEFFVILPKFTVRQESQPLSVLKAMGMKKITGPSADFSKLVENPAGLQVSECYHEAVVEVDENGTRASAATALMITRSGGTRSLAFDRPFYFVLYHRDSLAPLFVGQVVDPRSPSSTSK